MPKRQPKAGHISMAISCLLLYGEYAQDFYMLLSADVFLGFTGLPDCEYLKRKNKTKKTHLVGFKCFVQLCSI